MASRNMDLSKPPKVLPRVIMEVTHAVERTEMIYNAGQLRIFDRLSEAGRPVNASELGKAAEVSPECYDHMERLCCTLTHLGLLEKIVDETGMKFQNTEEAELYMTTKSPYSLLKLTDAARHNFDIAEFMKGSGVGDTTRTWFSDVEENNKAFKEVFFRFNRYYQKQDAYSKTCLHLLKAFDLSEFKTVVDLGGGVGSVCRALQRFYPGMNVINLDMPCVVDYAKKQEVDQQLDKLNYVAADVFSDEPLPKADLYIVGHFIHMFNDDVTASILKRIRQFIRPGGAILILEKVMEDEMEGPELCLLYSMRMALSSGRGKERTRHEYHQILTDNGFDVPQFFVDNGYGCYDAILAKKL